jgi:hypothetical protein
MTVLIAYASRHASTGGIAERVAAELRRLDHEVDVRAVDEAVDVGRYDAFVIGSAVEGVVGVDDRLSWRLDDSDLRPASGPLAGRLAADERRDV